AWCGIALASLIALLAKHFLGFRKNLRKIALCGIALIGITGLDLLAVSSLGFASPDLEWWDVDQITSWVNALLWVPHHVSSLIACLGGFLVLWTAIHSKNKGSRIAAALVAALSFSTAAGLSIYVVIAFAAFMALWTLSFLFERSWGALGTCLVAGVTA